MIQTALVSIALCVPGAHPTDCACGVGGYGSVGSSSITGPPVVRVFERRAEDADRRSNWNAYCRDLDQLWLQYRAAGSTPEAWRSYTAAADQAKLRYVTSDPYFVPIVGR